MKVPNFLRDAVLNAASQIYGAGLALIHFAYRGKLLKRHELPAKIISVGNLTWGGTGKTPLVLFLARALQGNGHKVAVLTRGYGQDESKLLADRLGEAVPVMVGPDRAASGQRAIDEKKANLLLLDDGYQQWRLKKDLEILTADAAAPFGNGHLIPRGILREPAAAAQRADLIVLKTQVQDAKQQRGAVERIRKHNTHADVFFMRYEPTHLWRWPSGQKVDLKHLKNVKVCTLAGIARPDQFESFVQSLGAQSNVLYRVMDHHAYTAGELMRLMSRCQRHGVKTIVTTAKDAVRLPKLLVDALGSQMRGMEILVLEVEPKFEPNENQFLHRIHSLLAGKKR